MREQNMVKPTKYASKPDLTQLFTMIEQKNSGDQVEAIKAFAEMYYEFAPSNELQMRKIEDLYGATISCWQFLQVHNLKEPKVRVFNPDFEAHGWQSTHTVIEVIAKDEPFIVDSVRMELNRRQMSIHSIHHCTLNIERNKKHELKLSSDYSAATAKTDSETIIYIEVDRHSSEETLESLKTTLEDILNEIDRCVSDFSAMQDRANEAVKMLKDIPCKFPSKELKEAQAFVEWMVDHHFTFLAYDEFTVEQSDKGAVIHRDNSHTLGITRSVEKKKATNHNLKDLPEEIQQFILKPELISYFKSGQRCRVHRPAYPDYVVVKKFNEAGEVIGGMRFMGLYTSVVYIETPNSIPLIRQKLEKVRELAGFDPISLNYKELNRILEIYPRDELFQSSPEELYGTALGILNIQERRQTRVFVRRDGYGKFMSCQVYTPRDVYNTELRMRMQAVLQDAYEPEDIEFNTSFSESILARIHFNLRLSDSCIGNESEVDEEVIEHKIQMIARSWQDNLHDALIEQVGEEYGNEAFIKYRDAFPASYREDFSSRTAVVDIQHMEALYHNEDMDINMSFYRELEEEENQLRFKLYNIGSGLPLSDVIPILENLGLRVLGEHPYGIAAGGKKIWIHNFQLEHSGDSVDMKAVKTLFQETFNHVWHGRAENDLFNRLVLGAELGWRQIAMLRGYARYMKQTRFGISESYIAGTLGRYINISKLLIDAFETRFSTELTLDIEARNEAFAKIEEQITIALDDVEQLNEDRIIRRFLEMIKATLRTNYYQDDEQGNPKDYISFKLNPHAISNMPLPRPMFEIFVYSPRVEGVHLRGGKVARGGLRWSDRGEDFRTEVLGLVKAQQVKNAVIVPVGAKGGFVAKQLPDSSDREAFMNEGIACYKTFISSLLDVTDNMVEGEVIPPKQVVRHDEDDVYLVVAADKGTATFSDIANGIAVDRGFWLGDAFASGGSIGYDHKKMGITARGAWVSVQRHFREMGINVQEEDFTVVGIGDMSGDVFGNGMLLSEHIQLCAAFNHLHIFVDPNPDSASSYVERKRMFELPRSTWDDYNKELISKGGGVFPRNAKSIAISPEMKKRFDISEDHLPPTELLTAILKSPVDLIWNGGIGTYIKGTSESHGDVGDKANDALRINGNQVRAKVIGEGGNLGVTQLARVEYGLNGGKSYTDFIDNAGGVDCSDHEVNIKIMLNDLIASGDMTMKQRNELFVSMTDDVAELVLNNNYHQTQAIALAFLECKQRLGEYTRLIRDFEEQGKLDRELEFLPCDEEIQERKNQDKAFTRPELSVLISYTKADLKEQLNHTEITQDPYISHIVETAFPTSLVEKFGDQVRHHKLCNEIVATQLANDLVNYMGITFVNRLMDSTGATVLEIARAYVAARDVFGLHELWHKIELLDYEVPTAIQESMMVQLMRLVRRSCRWFLRNRRSDFDVKKAVGQFEGNIEQVGANLSKWLDGSTKELWHEKYQELSDAGVTKELAEIIAGASSLYSSLGIIEAAKQADETLENMAEAYFYVGEQLNLNWFLEQINLLPVGSHWQGLAREAFRDDLDWQLRSLTVAVRNAECENDEPVCDEEGNELTGIERQMAVWKSAHPHLLRRWEKMLAELESGSQPEYAMYSVALRELLDLAQASRHCN